MVFNYAIVVKNKLVIILCVYIFLEYNKHVYERKKS